MYKKLEFEKGSREHNKKVRKQVVSLNQLEVAMFSYNAPACNC